MHLRPDIENAALPEDPPRREEKIPERKSRQVIASYRGRLEWILRVPDLEVLLEKGLKILNLPGPRKGIGLRAALSALPLENKYTLICWTFRNFRQRFPATFAERICREFGLDLFNSLELDEHLSLSQWARFEEAFLFALAKEHRRYKQAQSILFFTYRSLVERIVRRAVFDSGKHGDCIQEGCMALLHAIDKVDNGDTSMGAYAQMWIRRQITNYLMGERFAVHVPINLAAKALSQDTAKEAEKHQSPEETGGATVRSRRKDSRTREDLIEQLRQPSISLDQVFEESGSLSDILPDDEAPSPRSQTSRKDLRALVGNLIANLTDKQREVLELRYGLRGDGGSMTLAEISREIGISHQQVSMRERRALQKLEEELAPYLREILA